MNEPFVKNDIKIAVVGGGTGSFTLLSALKNHTKQLAAIVNMSDDGGSTGVLRDELGVLPPGDVRQCLVALSDSPKIRDLFNYRFEEGTFGGHSFGNILITALEKVTGDFSEAVQTASEILRVSGTVIPATLDNVRLKMEWPDASIILHGERVIAADYFKHDPRQATLSLIPCAVASPSAIMAIKQADMVVIAPGNLYASLGPLLVIDGIAEALKCTNAICVYVSNLVTKQGQTDGFTVSDYAAEIERFVGRPFLDYVLYNKQTPTKTVSNRYALEGAYIVKANKAKLKKATYKSVSGNFLGQMAEAKKSDILSVTRSLIRHDSESVACALIDLYNHAAGQCDTDIIDDFFVVDFDRCVGNVDASFELLKFVIDKLSIFDSAALQKARSEAEACNISFDAIEHIKKLNPGADVASIKAMYIEMAKPIRGSLLECGADEFINYLRSNNKHFCIMSYGNECWQKLKIEAVGLSDVPTVLVKNKRKGHHIANWFNEMSENFDIPGSCFMDGIGRITSNVVLVDDKAVAFEGLPSRATGYLVQGSAKNNSDESAMVSKLINKVLRINEIL